MDETFRETENMLVPVVNIYFCRQETRLATPQQDSTQISAKKREGYEVPGGSTVILVFEYPPPMLV